jgi:uncharacterized membrane protein
MRPRPEGSTLPSSLTAAGLALGFGLGGFFDGILLHQILQWHHLLSGIEAVRDDLRFLVMTDGLFHLFMYVVTAAGLFILYRARHALSGPGAGRFLVASALVGFGLWHMLDGILSHWLLGLHRIRMDVDNPLVWDILWFGLFGVAPAVLGVTFGRRPPGDPGRKGSRQPDPVVQAPGYLGRDVRRRIGGLAAATGLAVIALSAGTLAAWPAPGATTVVVVFRPGITPQDQGAALAAVDGRLVWTDTSGAVWAIEVAPGTHPLALYRHGALLVGGAGLPAGCLGWFKA